MLADENRTWDARVANHDLISSLANILREARHLCQGVFKVCSHQKHHGATCPAERWSFAGNDSADALAANSFQCDPELMRSWDTLCDQLDELRRLRHAMHQMMINIGIDSITKQPSKKPAVKAVRYQQPTLPMTDWQLPDQLPDEAAPYLIPEINKIVQWISSLHDTSHKVQRWSWWQLYVDACLHVSQLGPWYHTNTKKWHGGHNQPAEPFLRKTRWFAQFLTKLFKCCGVALPLAHAPPHGSIRAFWTATLPVQVDDSRTVDIDEKLQQYLPCASKTSDLRCVEW
eukprot:s728_g28.t1